MCIYEIIYQKLPENKLKNLNWLVYWVFGCCFWGVWGFWGFFFVTLLVFTLLGHPGAWFSYIINKSFAGSDQLSADLLPWPYFLLPMSELNR